MREKTKWLQVRMSPAEKAAIADRAAALGIGISELVRRAVSTYPYSAGGVESGTSQDATRAFSRDRRES